jgi:hypothetical protein
MNEISTKASKLINSNTFVNGIAYGLTAGLWSRYYSENLDFVWTQSQILILFLVSYVINTIASKKINFRKRMFNLRNKIGLFTKLIDITTIILFMITNNPVILIIGDTVACCCSITESIAWTELNSATFNGNFRAVHSARNEKASNLGNMIAYVISMFVAIFLVGDKPISYEVLLITQWLMAIITIFTFFRTLKLFRMVKPLVEEMWSNPR